MPKSQGVPSYRFHKARNCAVVTLDGRNHYLGPYDSPESKATYAEKIAEWQRNRISVPGAPAIATAGYTVGRLAADYRRFAEGYYRKNGESTTQVVRVQEALKPLVALYEELPAIEFGPLKLRNVQQHLVSRGLCRTYINSLMGCLKLAFKWAAAEEKIPASVPEALRYVTGLKRGRTTAPEPKPIEAVDEATVNETIKFLSPTVAAMVRLQLLSGARPGEMCSLRPCDVTLNIDGTACFRPESHKTEHHGRERRVYLGPLALAILKPFLERDTGANCFSPAESVAWHRDQHRAARKTPLWPSHQRRNATKRKPDPGRVAGDSFTAKVMGRPAAIPSTVSTKVSRRMAERVDAVLSP
jgi:integrase